MRILRGHFFPVAAAICCGASLLSGMGCGSRVGDISDIKSSDASDVDPSQRVIADPDREARSNGSAMTHESAVNRFREATRTITDLGQDAKSDLGKTGLQESTKQAAMTAMHQGQLLQAERMFAALMEQQPNDALIIRYAAQAANYRGNRADGNRWLRDASRLVILNQDELYGLMTPLASYLEIGSEIDPDRVHDSPVALNLIRELARCGDLATAIELLEGFEVDDPAAMTLKGRYLLLSQQFDELKIWYESRAAGWTRYPDFWFAVGGLARHLTLPNAASQAFGLAVAMEPYDRSAVIQLSACLQAVGQNEAATVYRERYDAIKELQDLTNDLVAQGNLPQRLYKIAERELVRIGQPIDAHGWQALGSGVCGKSSAGYLQAIQVRSAAVAAYSSEAAQRARLPGFEIRSGATVLRLVDRGLEDAKLKGRFDRLGSESHSEIKSEEPLQARFVNVASASQLKFQYLNAKQPVSKYFLLHQALGGGVACLDYDNDGNVDLYFAQGGCDPPAGVSAAPNLLARNLGGQFQPVTHSAGADDRGYSTALTVGDWNQDGFLDLVIGNLGVNHLLINQGDGTFRRRLAESSDDVDSDGSHEGRYTMGLAVADVTGDGLPDLIEVNYIDDPNIFTPVRFNAKGDPVRLPGPLQFRAASNRLFVAEPEGTLGTTHELVSHSDRGYSLGLIVTNLDGQGGNDIFVGNDQTANHFWTQENDSNKLHFVDHATVAGLAYGNDGSPMACMGIAAADFDHNGLLDLHVSNFYHEWSNHYLQSTPGNFVDQALRVGFDQPTYSMLGFGTQAIDWSNNGLSDLVIGNGHLEDFRVSQTPFAMPTQLFASDGAKMKLHQVEGDDVY